MFYINGGIRVLNDGTIKGTRNFAPEEPADTVFHYGGSKISNTELIFNEKGNPIKEHKKQFPKGKRSKSSEAKHD